MQLVRAAIRAARPTAAVHRRLTTMAAAKRVHFDSTTCPYAQRSWVALLEKGLDFEIRKVDLANKDAEFVSTYHSINPDESAPAKVPILLDGDVRLVESGVIVDYLNKRYPSPPLEPEDAAAAARARLFIELFGTHFTARMFGLFGTTNPEEVEEARAKLAAGIKVLDSTLRLHGSEEGGSYFLGGFYSVAEVYTTGFVQRGLATLKEYRSVDLAALVKEAGADRFERWMHAALARPSAQQTKPSDEVIVEGLRKFVAPFKG